MALFHKSSGVLYTETTSAQVKTMLPTWMSQARGKRDKKSFLRSRGKGCSRLQDMALRSCAFHAELFEPAALQWAGWHYAKRIYQLLLNIEALTYTAWNIFSNAYPNEMNHQHQFHIYQDDESPHPTQFYSITHRLANLHTHFITFLCIRNFSLTVQHLTALLHIPTLAATMLQQRRSDGKSLTPRNFLDFGRAAREKSALGNLRLLIMCDFDLGCKTVLQGVGGLSALRLVGLQDSVGDLHVGFRDGNGMGIEYRLVEESHLPNLQNTWTCTSTTTSSKLEKLYELTFSLSFSPLQKDMNTNTNIDIDIANDKEKNVNHFQSLSITYSTLSSRALLGNTTWFVRDAEAYAREEREERARDVAYGVKRRRIREGKCVGLEEVLGGF